MLPKRHAGSLTEPTTTSGPGPLQLRSGTGSFHLGAEVENEVTGEWLGWEIDREVTASVAMLPSYGNMRSFPPAEEVYACRRQLCTALEDLCIRGEA